jgi:hypothetical protein
MEYFAGLDVAMEESTMCVIDREGKVILETTVTTDPDAIFKALNVAKLRRVGHEAGSLSAVAASRTQATGSAGDLPRSLACAGGAGGDAQQDRQSGCARHCPHRAHESRRARQAQHKGLPALSATVAPARY